jgi:hypothetical protein
LRALLSDLSASVVVIATTHADNSELDIEEADVLGIALDEDTSLFDVLTHQD